MRSVSIVDYGLGNLFSVFRALEYCGVKPIFANNAKDIERAEVLILPGVGAFANGMHGLKTKDLINPIKDYAASGKLFLGICLGMQMLFDESNEFGQHTGLGIIPGKVLPIPKVNTTTNQIHKIPHIGWKNLTSTFYPSWEDTLLHTIEPLSKVYFVHSFMVEPTNPLHRLADCYYNKQKIAAVIRDKNIYGCQFHPEKSGKIGLKILENFVNLVNQ